MRNLAANAHAAAAANAGSELAAAAHAGPGEDATGAALLARLLRCEGP